MFLTNSRMGFTFMEYIRLEKYKKTLQLTRSPIDKRDYRVHAVNRTAKLPTSVNLASNCPPVYDQLDIGSCTANSASTMYSYVLKLMTSIVQLIPSRLYVYYNTRILQGTIGQDSGASLRNTMKALVQQGVCPEGMWGYSKLNLFTKPPDACYTEGAERQALLYASVPLVLDTMKKVLQTNPFIMGILVYSSFMYATTAKTGMVPLPNTRRERLLGGHAICIIGYDDKRQAFLVRNSWGTGWGLQGDFYLPYRYATDPRLSFDSWVLYSVEVPNLSSNTHFQVVRPCDLIKS